MTDQRTLPELFAEVREEIDRAMFTGARRNPRLFAALDAIADRQHETVVLNEQWGDSPASVCRCVPGYVDPNCLALRAACKGGKG
jgi:hypothetical protein